MQHEPENNPTAEIGNSDNPKQELGLLSWITIAFFLIVGTISILPSIFPTAINTPDIKMREKCENTERFMEIPHVTNEAKAQIISDWCAIAGSNKTIPKIKLTDTGASAAMRSPVLGDSYLEIGYCLLNMDRPGLRFAMAHEYQHLIQRHSVYRHIFTGLLIFAFVFSLLQWIAFKRASKVTRIAYIFIVPISAYLLLFYSYSSHESDADKHALKLLTQAGFDANEDATSFIQFMKKYDLEKHSTSPLSLCLINQIPLFDLHNCDPHPSRALREKDLLKN